METSTTTAPLQNVACTPVIGRIFVILPIITLSIDDDAKKKEATEIRNTP